MPPTLPEEILALLREGNRRFMADRCEGPRRDPARRGQLLEVQTPHAAVLSCSDSRVPPEIVFDQGLGDLFVVRTAGQVADSTNLGSLEFAVEVLGVRLIVVMGHEGCGAVDAAVKARLHGHEPAGEVLSVVQAILPAVPHEPGDPVSSEEALRHQTLFAHVRRTASIVRDSAPILKPRVEGGELLVVPAFYWLADGRVEILED